jgi:putative ATP-binding cassette transporter
VGARAHLLPEGAMFIPQRPYFPDGPLRDALAYPEPASHYSDEQLKTALQDALLPDLAASAQLARRAAPQP